jgi:hypothetical protein
LAEFTENPNGGVHKLFFASLLSLVFVNLEINVPFKSNTNRMHNGFTGVFGILFAHQNPAGIIEFSRFWKLHNAKRVQ